jgi:hypothetical protein
MHCPGCGKDVPVPDIGARNPPGTEITCSCGDVFGILYIKRDPVLIWWQPSRPITVRNVRDDS